MFSGDLLNSEVTMLRRAGSVAACCYSSSVDILPMALMNTVDDAEALQSVTMLLKLVPSDDCVDYTFKPRLLRFNHARGPVPIVKNL